MSAASTNVLREAFEYEFSPLDPVGGAHIDPTSNGVYETIVVKGTDMRPAPSLAQSWRQSADGLEWRFELRPGLRFHSGAACDAPAIAAALHRCRVRDGKTPQRHYWDPVDVVRAEGERTIVIRTRYPTTRVMSLLWGTHTTIFNEGMRDQEDPFSYGIEVADGTGPFRLVSLSSERVVTERAPTYSGSPAPFLRNGRAEVPLAGVEWLAIVSADERLRMLDRGAVDCLHAPPPGEVDAIARDPRFRVLTSRQSSNIYFALDWARQELGFDDLRVRRALSLAIDRPGIIAAVVAGRGRPTYGPMPPDSEFYRPDIDAGGRHDPGQAALLLDQAGWRLAERGLRWKDGRPFSFHCVVQRDEVLEGTAGEIARQLRTLGIEITVEAVKPFQPFYERLRRGTDSFISKWLWEDPVDALIGFTSTLGQSRINWQHASIPKLDAAFDAWCRAGDDIGLAAAAGTVQEVISAELPLIPLFTPTDYWVHRAEVSGWRPVPGNLYPFYQDVEITQSSRGAARAR
ncbi:MAG: ABC transporter substrate-binding protein [Dehalococcoidia bacterium]